MPQETRRIPLSTPFGRQVGPRFSVRGPLLSAAAHVGLVLALLYAAHRSAEALAAAGSGPGRGGGGGGGGNRQFTVVLQAPPAAKAAPAPQPKPPETPQLVVPRTVQPLDSIVPPTAAAAATQQAAGPGSGAGAGPGSGTGTGGGTGSGTGPGTGSGVGRDSGGAGGDIFPAQPSTIMPPIFQHVPSELKGVRITVRFDIGERGDILGIETDPDIRDRDFRNQFMAKMRQYEFTPAYNRSGRAVRSVYPMYFRL